MMDSSAGDPPTGGVPEAISSWISPLTQRYQHLLDKATPHVLRRWLGFAAVAIIYAIRVWFAEGFYIVSYALGIYVLNIFIAFLSPQVDPEIHDALDADGGAVLPTRSSDEFRPFVRRLPEFKFWYSITKAFCIAFVATFFTIFDVPVFWPILLFYWVMLCTVTMKRQIRHMIKYRYLPFSFGKQHYRRTSPSSSEDATLPTE
ncbi:protein RER1A-like isoform X1 [Typha latifolia]|uniref:protein RER1A-like isoform X1 n=1 Tax=Typha latifolia TaxID=4733 RepID=UPI003C2F6447